MQAKGADEIFWRDYTASSDLAWPTMDGSPSEYDLYLISYKLIEFKQGADELHSAARRAGAAASSVAINPRSRQKRGVERRRLRSGSSRTTP